MKKDCKHIIVLVTKEFKNLIVQDDLERASNLLWELAEICGDNRSADEIVVLKRGISDLNREHRLGKINFKQASEVKNHLADRLLRIANAWSPYADYEDTS